jgi:Ca-activated chloride channel family protein
MVCNKEVAMIFAEAGYLYLLLLIPVFIIVQTLVLKIRRSRLQKFGDETLVKSLMPSYSKAKVWLRLSFFLLAFFFFVLGISRPQMGAILKEHKTRGAEVMIVLDVSNSMLAEDYSPNRLERAKLAISRMVDKLREDRIGLIVFAGNSFVQLPITTDYVSAKMFLNSISTESVPIQGTAIGDAISTALRSFSAQSDKSRAIIVITDGENHEDDPVAAASQAAELGVRVFAIGVGSPEGKMIPFEGDYLRDKEGNPVVTRLDETVLQEVAAAGKGIYVRAGNSEFGLNPIIDEIARMDDEEYNSVVFEEYDELYMYFFAVALFFLVLEMLIGDRRSKYHLFKR